LAAVPALAQAPGEPLRFETLRDAYQRQQADDYRTRANSRSLLQNERATALGDSRVHQTPRGGYAIQPEPAYSSR
jgi:hypothetical protein